MTSVEFGFSLIGFIFLGVAFTASARYFRKLKMERLPLRKNCLLTRKPILVLTNPQRFWTRLFAKQLHLHEYLSAHGYDCFHLTTPERMTSAQARLLAGQIDELAKSTAGAHIFNLSGSAGFEQELRLKHNLSITSLHNQSPEEALSIAISLAEKEIQCSH
jgi:hypothetical protein